MVYKQSALPHAETLFRVLRPDIKRSLGLCGNMKQWAIGAEVKGILTRFAP